MNDSPLHPENDIWMPFAFSPDYQSVEWVKTDIEALRQAPFLDHRSLVPTMARRTTRVQESLDSLPTRVKTPPMIFHSAFCCSTLLAKALDKRGKCLSLKEPNILMSLANAKRILAQNGRPREEFNMLFNLVMHWLNSISAEPVIIKPTNAANNLLETVNQSGGNAVLMYSSLEDLIISVLKKGESCKSFFRTQFNIFSLDPCALASMDKRRAMTFTDLQIVTLVWRHQMELFQKQKSGHKLLKGVDFLGNKSRALNSAVAALNLPHSDADIRAVVDSEIFAKDVKFTHLPLSTQARKKKSMAVRERYKTEIDETLDWAKNLRLESDIPDILASQNSELE